MLDNQLIALFRPIIISGLTAAGVTGVSVVQSNQPTEQGVSTNATVYFTKISDVRYGFMRSNTVLNRLTNLTELHQIQSYETTFQIEALAPQDPAVISLTASDIVKLVADILQQDDAINTLNLAGVGVLRITDVRNPYFIDEHEEYEASPSFDFTLAHTQEYIKTVPAVISVDEGIHRI